MHFTFIALILVIWFSYCTQLLVNYLGRLTFLLHICFNFLRHKDTASLMFSCLYQTPRTLEDQPCCPYLTWVCLFSPLKIWEDLYHWVSACCVLRPAPLDPDAFHLIPLSPAPPQSIYTCLLPLFTGLSCIPVSHGHVVFQGLCSGLFCLGLDLVAGLEWLLGNGDH